MSFVTYLPVMKIKKAVFNFNRAGQMHHVVINFHFQRELQNKVEQIS